MDAQREAIERALGYPFGTPTRSYLLRDGGAVELDPSAAAPGGRIPLLAYGSNASPDVLALKLGRDADPVPVVLAALAGFDAVYSAHVAVYGSVPATLHPSPGTAIPVFIAHVTADQLERIGATEPNYELETLGGIECRPEIGEPLTEAAAYLTRHGPLLVDGRPAALAAIEARGRALSALTQRQALDHVRSLLRPDLELETFILEWVAGRIPARPLDVPEAP
jgi:hypothetical protein